MAPIVNSYRGFRVWPDNDLRQVVKSRIMEAVRKPIRKAREKFVENNEHQGTGVKSRILDLFISWTTGPKPISMSFKSLPPIA